MAMFDFQHFETSLTEGSGYQAMTAVADESGGVVQSDRGSCVIFGVFMTSTGPLGGELTAPTDGLLPTGYRFRGSATLAADGENIHLVNQIPIPPNTTITVKGKV